ncbi:hypothetical protein K490DRAFT_76323 [Saccharata proteae CBS 121410]|uniref:Ribosome quality control complex subunit 2 n=1 Tax=Saccharata proteae CBS 121410 TaxID=1314787 RepID=A0A9P4LTG6_9PEZI|nr:hypothetical protein K490DRAFT_76323 [Saccharata proteae CBS 121410]
MKQRFSSLDVKVIAHELSNSLVSLRVANIYDLSTRIFLFKFHKPDHREQLIVDSGFRCHLTSFARATAAAPSAFVVRLRKFLKTRRVTSIKQVGTDRIIEFQFSDGLYRLFLEFYAGGNIILTDAELNIVALLRTVEEGAEHERLRVGLQYNLSLRQNYNGIPELTKERVKEGLQKFLEKQQDVTDKKARKKDKGALRKALAVSITELPPMLVDHAFAITEFDTGTKPEQVLEDEVILGRLMEALREAKRVDAEITSADIAKGYIIAKTNSTVQKEMYEDFHPFKPRQFENDPSVSFLEYEGFNACVDEFFSSIEGQKLESRLHEREENAKRKIEQAQRDHNKRIDGLQQVQELNVRKAEAIQANVDRVQEAANAVNGLIEKGMDWIEIDRLIEREQKMGNPVAEMIKLPLKLHENTATLLLSEPNIGDDEDDYEGSETESELSSDEEEDQQKHKKDTKPADNRLTVDIDLGLSPWANAKIYFDQKKTAAVKEERTKEASQRALKSTEKKIGADLKKGLKQEKDVLRPVRKQYWFEKFMYFLSSDGYLILGGKDGMQNEILYKRYLKKGDIYVHADLGGAASVVIKNNPATPDAPIPPSTLSQAGNIAVATSSAWDSKAVMSAWWVNADQVSKISEKTGEFLDVNVFEIRGKKNFLPPAQLLLGFAVMFQITEESKANHQKHRLQDGVSAAKEDAPMSAADMGGEEAQEEKEGENHDSDSDSDEDFPDAKLDSGSEDSEGETPDQEERSNPLQSANGSTESEEARRSEPEDEQEKAQEEEQEAQDSTRKSEQSQATSSKSGHRHLSARERRLLRKGQLPDELTATATASAEASESEDDDVQSSTAAPSSNPSQPTSKTAAPPKKQAPLPRGKRAKAKKLAAKYADQDEEDRALALRLLGAKAIGTDNTSADEASTKPTKEAKEAELQAQKQRRREQHLRTQEKGKAEEEKRRAAQEGEIGDEEDHVDDESTKISLDSFVGRPLPGDNLVAAIPVCAPWSALAAYKYKVKLQPGAAKKGKAVKEILARWEQAFKNPKWTDKGERDVERIWPSEVELVRQWKEAEVFGVVPVGKGGSGGGDKKTKGKGGRGGRGKKR